jgi:hypothetical protein
MDDLTSIDDAIIRTRRARASTLNVIERKLQEIESLRGGSTGTYHPPPHPGPPARASLQHAVMAHTHAHQLPSHPLRTSPRPHQGRHMVLPRMPPPPQYLGRARPPSAHPLLVPRGRYLVPRAPRPPLPGLCPRHPRPMQG